MVKNAQTKHLPTKVPKYKTAVLTIDLLVSDL